MNIADKLKILNLIDNGEKIAVIVRRFQVNESSIRTIRDNKDKIRNIVQTVNHHRNCEEFNSINVVKQFWKDFSIMDAITMTQ